MDLQKVIAQAEAEIQASKDSVQLEREELITQKKEVVAKERRVRAREKEAESKMSDVEARITELNKLEAIKLSDEKRHIMLDEAKNKLKKADKIISEARDLEARTEFKWNEVVKKQEEVKLAAKNFKQELIDSLSKKIKEA